mgnify:CR=1 FL=1
MLFERLDSKIHDRKSFDCGVEALNLYVQRVANQEQNVAWQKFMYWPMISEL